MLTEKSELIFWGIYNYGNGKITARRHISTSLRKLPSSKRAWGRCQVLPGEAEERFDTLGEARACFYQMGLTCYDRGQGDPKQLLEVWV